MRLFYLPLDVYQGVRDYLTPLTKLKLDLTRAGETVPSSLMAGAILWGMGARFPTAKELMLDLRADEQTKDILATRLLEAEKNSKLSTEMAAMALAPPSAPALIAGATTRGPSRYPPCTYVRKYPGKGARPAVGNVCGSRHKPGTCWAKLDDDFLAANPAKTAADLPNRCLEMLIKRAQGAT